MTCAIIGDSIALGVSIVHPGCEVSAKVGRPATEIVRHPVPDLRYDYAVISAGSNNPNDPHLRQQLETIRLLLDAKQIVWIQPHNSARAAKVVRDVAAEHRDSVAMFNESRDGTHPRSYPGLWQTVSRLLTASVRPCKG